MTEKILFGLCVIVVGAMLWMVVDRLPEAGSTAPPDPKVPKETILHIHVLDKSMCRWPA